MASVCEIVGKRLHVKYYDSSPEDNGFWCHEDSPLIHPVGWAFRVGHPLDAPQTYCQRVAAGRLLPNDTTPDMFYKYPTNEPPLFTEGILLHYSLITVILYVYFSNFLLRNLLVNNMFTMR